MAKSRTAAPAFTTILLVRHGNTPTTGKVLPGRAKGLSLSDTGRNQAKTAAERIAALARVDAIYCSPLERARETAAPIAAQRGLKAKIDRGLLECEFGDWTGAQLSKLSKLPEWSTVQRARQRSGSLMARVSLKCRFAWCRHLIAFAAPIPVAPSCASHMLTRSKRPLRTLLVHTLISSNELSSPHARYQLSHGHHTGQRCSQ